MPPVSMSLNAHGARLDAESETLLPTTGGVFDVAHSLRGEGFDAGEDGTGRGTPLVPVAYGLSTQQEPKWSDDVAPTLARPSPTGGGQTTAVAYRTAGDGAAYEEGDAIAPLTTGTDQNAQIVAFSSKDYVAQPWAVRRLTPRECERLQGFPDDFTAIPWRGKPADQCPDGPRYKGLGNSWARNVGEWIFDRIRIVDAMRATA